MPRFAVVQGTKHDGSMKVRAVDHFSWSAKGQAATGQRKRKRSKNEVKAQSVNGHTLVPEKVTHDHLDDIAAVMAACKASFNEVPALWKVCSFAVVVL